MDTTRVGEKRRPEEIVAQIRLAEQQPVSAGHIHWNMKSLARSAELQAALKGGAYAEPALVPACPWLTTNSLHDPVWFISGFKSGNLRMFCKSGPDTEPWLWLVQIKSNGAWKTEILVGDTWERIFGSFHPDVIAVTQIDRSGVCGKPIVLTRKD